GDVLVPAGAGAGRPGESRVREETSRFGARGEVGRQARGLHQRGEQRARIRQRQWRSAGAALAVPATGSGEGGNAARGGAEPEGARGQGVAARAGLFEQAGDARLQGRDQGRAGGAGQLAEGQEYADALVSQSRVWLRLPRRQG